IGNNFYQTGFLKIDFANNSNLNFEIGDNCMFGQNINFMLGDFHKIIDLKTSEQTNKSKSGIKIGNHVWIARDVKVLKDISIPNNTIIATQSLVTKSFTEENTLIGGVPAKILKQDVTWQI
ncbi:acyltransferase, partial [bacterium]|nr:acyltransferase [bacterium]